MKKITKIIPAINILITTVLLIFLTDINQSKNYLQFDSYKKGYISLDYNENIEIDSATIEKILKIAKDNNVIIQKSNFDNNKSKIRNTYLSFDTTNELYEFINNEFDLKTLNDIFDKSDLFISTYYHNSKNQIALIPDLLNNDYYNYYRFEKLLSSHGNLYGEYIVYYKEYNDFAKFSAEVKNFLGQDIVSHSQYNDIQKYIVILAIFSVVILMIFYFIFQIYELYYDSKHIGCMRLLGYSKFKISIITMKKKIKSYCLMEIFIFMLVYLFVKNITISNLIFILIINIILIILTFIIGYSCVKIISHSYNISNILKKQNIAIRISKTSGKLKVIIVVLLIVFLSVFFSNLVPIYSELKVYKNSKELLNYGVIASFNPDTKELYDYEKHSKLFKFIVNDSNLKTFYSSFGNYVKMTTEEEAVSKSFEEKGTYYRYGSVDRNYLKKENIAVYDMNNNIVDLEDIEGVFFLFPKSKKNIIDSFNTFYQQYSAEDYSKYHIENIFKAYIYDDQKLNTYRLDLEIKYIASPILRVITDELSISYIESPLGVDVFGTSLTTGLKIEINNNQNETFEILKQDIKKAGLENLIGVNNFMSFSSYFDNEIRISKVISFIALMIISLIVLIYTIISIQAFSLYVKSDNQRVTIKYLLGYDKEKIFSVILDKNVIYNIVSFFIALLILILIRKFNILFYSISISMFLIVDLVISFSIIKSYNFSKIYIQLKGGSYD